MTDNLADNTIRAYLLPGANIDPNDHMRTCKASRDWMDGSPQKYVYRCIPLIAANTMGWELINPVDAEIVWTCLLYTSPSPRDLSTSRMPSSA